MEMHKSMTNHRSDLNKRSVWQLPCPTCDHCMHICTKSIPGRSSPVEERNFTGTRPENGRPDFLANVSQTHHQRYTWTACSVKCQQLQQMWSDYGQLVATDAILRAQCEVSHFTWPKSSTYIRTYSMYTLTYVHTVRMYGDVNIKNTALPSSSCE